MFRKHGVDGTDILMFRKYGVDGKDIFMFRKYGVDGTDIFMFRKYGVDGTDIFMFRKYGVDGTDITWAVVGSASHLPCNITPPHIGTLALLFTSNIFFVKYKPSSPKF